MPHRPDAETRKAIQALRDSAEERLMSERAPSMIPVEGGEPMVWTEHERGEPEWPDSMTAP